MNDRDSGYGGDMASPWDPDGSMTEPSRRGMRPVTRAVGWSILQSWGSSFFAFFITIALARLLDPQAFGLIALALVYVSFVSVFVDQGLGSALIQRANLQPEHLDTAFWISSGVGVVLAVISVVAADPIAASFQEPALAPVVQWLSLGLIFAGLQSTQRAIVMRQLEFGSLAKRILAANLAGGLLGIACAVAGLGVWSLVVQTLTKDLTATTLLWRISDWRPSRRFSLVHFRELFGFSANILGSNLLTFANRHADNFLIGIYLGPVALGYYTVAYDISRKMMTLLIRVITRVSFPFFSRFQQDPDRMRSAFYKATHLTCIVAFPAFIGIAAVAPEFIRTVYGDKWAPSIPVVQILALVGIYNAVFSFNGSVLLSAGKASWQMILNGITTLAAIIAFAIAVRWGIVAVALGLVISRYALAPLPAWMLHRLLRLKIGKYISQYAVPAAGSILMLGAVLGLRAILPDNLPPSFALVAYIAAGIIVYAGFLSFTRREILVDGWGHIRHAIATRGSESQTPA